jgi:hypothetical protein
MTNTAHLSRRSRILILLLATAALLSAHNGPPFPMISERPMGPWIISLWTHPDVGIGTFFVVVDSAPGRAVPQGYAVPQDVKFEIGVRPVSGRLQEKLYRTTPKQEGGQFHYYAWVPFDKEETWHVNLYLHSPAWNGMIAGDVNVTPVGLGSWDLLFFSAPFLGVGFLWLLSMKRRRRQRS